MDFILVFAIILNRKTESLYLHTKIYRVSQKKIANR